MMKIYNMAFSLVAIVFVLCLGSLKAQDVPQKLDFYSPMIRESIRILPDEYRSRIEPLYPEMIQAINSERDISYKDQVCYFVDKKTGNAPNLIANQFGIVKKSLGNKGSGPALAESMGKLAAYIISASQPYHTDEAAYASSGHAAFETQLGESVNKFEVAFDGYQRVDNPSQFAIGLAVKGNRLLKQIDGGSLPEINSELLSTTVNALADVWVTLFAYNGSTNAKAIGAKKSGGDTYIGNKNSMKFHMPSCRFLPGEKNRVIFGSRQEALSKGYVPCKICKP